MAASNCTGTCTKKSYTLYQIGNCLVIILHVLVGLLYCINSTFLYN